MKREKDSEKTWKDFQETEGLSDDQFQKFKIYEEFLSYYNDKVNLTSLKSLPEILNRHFSDSFILRKAIDLSKVKIVADIGSGAGFPSLPLKILYPNLGVILIEVRKKRQEFLRELIDKLNLKNVEICDLDWRTFLRKTEGDVEYFFSRASLEPKELCRAFKPSSPYKDSTIIYWGAEDWEPEKSIKNFVDREFTYSIKRKKRKLIFMKLKEGDK